MDIRHCMCLKPSPAPGLASTLLQIKLNAFLPIALDILCIQRHCLGFSVSSRLFLKGNPGARADDENLNLETLQGEVEIPTMAQEQAQTTISYTESLELVRCLLRVSVFHVTAMRGLFPDSFYKDITMKNLDGMSIKVLTPQDDESKRLVDWIEGGVYDAVKRGFLKSLLFGISKNAEGTDLIEEYVYNFSYGSDGGVQMDIVADIKGKGKRKEKCPEIKEKKVTVSHVRYQVTRLMRMLIQLCKTLDRVPSERYLFCRLVYHDHAPDDYEPQYFRSMNDSTDLGHFSKKPFTMQVGSITTEHHQVGMRLKSILDACDAEGEIEAVEEQASGGQTGDGEEHPESMEDDAQGVHLAKDNADLGQGVTTQGDAAPVPPAVHTIPSRQRCNADIQALMTEPQEEEEALIQQLGTQVVNATPGNDVLPEEAEDFNNGDGGQGVLLDGAMSPDEDEVQGAPPQAVLKKAEIDAVKTWCLERSQVDVEDVMLHFVNLSATAASSCLSRLEQEGVLQATSRRSAFRVIQKEAAGDQGLVSHMSGMLMDGRAPAKLAVNDATDAGMENAGSDVTMAPSDGSNGGCDSGVDGAGHVGTKRAAPAALDVESTMPSMVPEDALPDVFFDASQQSSRRAAKQRKVSYVAEPIHQTNKMAKTAAKGTPGGHSRLGRMRR